jgi:G3E family GTPase
MDPRIPVTVLTGFLGSGKTTLLNRILSENHGRRIAVIENEFGEVGVDNELVINADEEVFEMNNGCICCTVRGDLIRILGQLLKRRDRFDYILVETTGLADPGPVAQTFIVDHEVKEAFRLDGIVTLVDVHHVERHLDTSEDCRKQVAFADVILLNKTDLCTGEAVAALERRLRAMNAAARIHRTEHAVLPLEHLLHIHAFDLAAKLAQDADFLVEELPFEWGGLYRLQAGIGELVLQPGPDPTMDLVAFARIPGSAGPDTLHEARIEALRRFSQPPVTLEPGGSLLPGPHRYRLALDASGPSRFLLRVAEPTDLLLYTQHRPEEFGAVLGGFGRGSLEPTASQDFGGPGHEHDASVSSVGIEDLAELDAKRLNAWLGELLQTRGEDLFRCKGILNFRGSSKRVVFQGVHMLLESNADRAWRPGETRFNRLVFIGRNLDREALVTGFRSCHAG